jgi:uncharacterized membrane protein
VEGSTPNDQGSSLESSHSNARTRVLMSLAVGVLALGIAMFLTPWQAAALIGWDVAASVFIVWVWLAVGRMDGEATKAHAGIEDRSTGTADLVLILASVTSLIGVGLSLLEASDQDVAAKAFITAIASLTVILSWATVHTVFTLRYARLYYAGEGGIDFNEASPPTYGDFAYLAFTIGMTYQVSDTSIGSRAIRRTALRHAYMSYLFGTVVVAMTINVLADLFNR